LIAYNSPRREQNGRAIDYLSEVDVLHEVEAVRSALLELGYECGLLPMQKSVAMFIDRAIRYSPSAVFNLVESWQGESEYEMHFPSVFELLGVPYTGSPALTLGTANDKWMTKTLLRQAKLPVPHGVICSEVPGRCPLRYPVIVKPLHEDASLGVDAESVVNNLTDLRRRVAWVVQNYHQPALVEEYVDGRELNVAVIGDQWQTALPISEITFDKLPADVPRIVSYNAKWVANTVEYTEMGAVCPAPLPEDLTLKIQNLAVEAFRLLGCRDYARVDFRLSPQNEPFILEVNPNPGIAPDAGLARSVLASGRTYTQFIGDVVTFALQRGERHEHPRSAPRRPAVHRTAVA
jgi:D-alanine-D-alanine ligase